jgi:hypothetical protein
MPVLVPSAGATYSHSSIHRTVLPEYWSMWLCCEAVRCEVYPTPSAP